MEDVADNGDSSLLKAALVISVSRAHQKKGKKSQTKYFKSGRTGNLNIY